MPTPSPANALPWHPPKPWRAVATLPGSAYWSEEVFQRECERLFFADWICVGRAEELPHPHDYVAVTFAGEGIVIARDDDGALHAFYNVCRHRGTKLCDDGPGHAKNGRIVCPYHAWAYAMNGQLVGTGLARTEGIDKSNIRLKPIAVDTWEGFIFINLSGQPTESLADRIARDPEQPDQFSRFHLGELRIGRRIVTDYRANWKISMENYNECLHCALVHPELTKLVPLYRTGMAEENEASWGVSLGEKVDSMTLSGTSSHPQLPGLNEDDRRRYYGFLLFPMANIDMYSNMVIASYRFPLSAERFLRVADYLFHPTSLADPDFDPSDLIDFNVLVSTQDQAIVERAQTGMRSRSYQEGGVLTYNDLRICEFNDKYRRAMGD